MKSKNLLSQLSVLEATLNNFSFEELSTDEASRLQKSFLSFKTQLEDKIWGENKALIPEKKLVSDVPAAVAEARQKDLLLIATVSHEIRTPLNGILGFADLLCESTLNKEQLQQVNAIQSASQGLMNIINELLEYSKLSAGLEHFETVDFSFNSLVKDVMYLCETLILEKNVKIKTQIDPAIPKVLVGDPSKLSQVLLNIMGNAIKFVEEGEIVLRVDLKKNTGQSVFLDFEISDTGIGMAENELNLIFDTFKQGNDQLYVKYGGTGLGLSIVKQIVEKLNGEIRVKSSLGVGTAFKFQLPYGVSTKPNVSEKDTPAINPKEVHGMRILIFEDNPLNKKVIGERLKAWNCTAYITENALYGLNILENNAIDLVLMDLRMPVMSGFEVTKRIRKSSDPLVREVPIIALTADFTIKDKDMCNQVGINDYILKPYSTDELLTKLVENRGTYKNRPMKTAKTEILSSALTKKDTSIDLDPLLQDCMGKIDLLEELIGLYKQNALEFIGELSLHLQRKDFEAVAFAAHKIKCGLKMMRTQGLNSLVEQIHKTSRTSKDIKHLRFLHNCFLEEYPRVENEIDAEMKKLKQK